MDPAFRLGSRQRGSDDFREQFALAGYPLYVDSGRWIDRH